MSEPLGIYDAIQAGKDAVTNLSAAAEAVLNAEDVMVERAVWYWNGKEISAFQTMNQAECAVRRYTGIGFSHKTEIGFNGKALTFAFGEEVLPHTIVLEQRSIHME